MQNNYLYADQQSQKNLSDTVNASFTLSLGASSLVSTDTSVNFQFQNRLHNFGGDTILYTDYNQNLSIELDTILRVATVVKSTLSSELHYNDINISDYWDRYVNGIDVGGVTYRLSTKGDTLSIKLNSTDLKQLKKYFITQYTEHQTTHTYTSFVSENFLDIPDSAYVNVTITGSFPLSVISQTPNSKNSIVDLHSKILKISSAKFNNQLPCYDLLGRKHNLEFLGTDGAASTYSVRSLPAGVYFVSDGREMVKFLIEE